MLDARYINISSWLFSPNRDKKVIFSPLLVCRKCTALKLWTAFKCGFEQNPNQIKICKPAVVAFQTEIFAAFIIRHFYFIFHHHALHAAFYIAISLSSFNNVTSTWNRWFLRITLCCQLWTFYNTDWKSFSIKNGRLDSLELKKMLCIFQNKFEIFYKKLSIFLNSYLPRFIFSSFLSFF